MAKKKIALQQPPDFSSIVPADLSGNAPSPTSSGIDMHNLAPEQANSIPDEGSAHVGFKVHRRSSETRIHPETGDKTEHHSVHMHLSHFHPSDEEAPKKKKLTDSTDAADAVRDGIGGSEMA